MSATSVTDADQHLFAEGNHTQLHRRLGAHVLPRTRGAPPRTRFAVWAPHAARVSVVGEFNHGDPETHPLRRLDPSGIWEAELPGIGPGTPYKFWILPADGEPPLLKADPFAFYAEARPGTASIVFDLGGYSWSDDDWLARRQAGQRLDAPITIYEVHLGSWMRLAEERNRWLSYRELAPRLAQYVTEMGFTHVEFLPLTEYPLDASWGYQPTGYFAPTSRFGTPHDFMFLVDVLHQNGIGVILDWVPAHFPSDAHGLARFDGSPLFEHPDPRRGINPEWGTLVFDYGCPEVASFLLSSARHWLETYHIDGLRVDAVASMLYLDYARSDGEWVPNRFGGRENLEAIAFLRRLNDVVHREHPGVLTIAEESDAFPNVSRPTAIGGLGFDLKWDMGWMHDTLIDYMPLDPLFRKGAHGKLTFRMVYAFDENFVLVLSHDEVAREKGSLLSRMPGDDWQRRANLRLLFGYMYGLPGKKLLFMGNEFGQWRSWDEEFGLDWPLLDDPRHAGIRRWVRDLNTTYRGEPALHSRDCDRDGFAWIDCNDVEQSVLCMLRRGSRDEDLIVIICNFTPVPRHNYRVGVPRGGNWDEILNSDATLYGGSGQGNLGGVVAAPVPAHGHRQSLNLVLPPLAMIALKLRPT